MPPRTVHPRRRHGHLPTTDILDLDGVDRLSARAFHALITTARLHVRSMSEALAGSGCHHGQAICLRLLSTRDGATPRASRSNRPRPLQSWSARRVAELWLCEWT